MNDTDAIRMIAKETREKVNGLGYTCESAISWMTDGNFKFILRTKYVGSQEKASDENWGSEHCEEASDENCGLEVWEDDMLHEQRECGTGKETKNGNAPIMKSVLATVMNPLFIVSCALGAMLSHFVIGPLIFG